MKEVVITLNEAFNQANCCECATVTITGADGKKRTRVVSVESVIMALRNSMVMQKVNVAVGKIPFGYYDAQVSEEQGKFSADMVAVLPAGKQMMQYEETLYDVSVPSLVFCFSVTREKIMRTRVYAMRDETPTDKSCLCPVSVWECKFGRSGMLGRKQSSKRTFIEGAGRGYDAFYTKSLQFGLF